MKRKVGEEEKKMHAPKRICSSVFRVEGAAATGGATTNLVNAYCKPLQMYQQPLEIAYFSYDHQRQLLLNSRSELKYYYPPPLNSGLSAGFPEKFVKRPAVPEHLDALLRSMLDTRQQRNNTTSTNIDPKSSLKQLPKFITWRGLITKLMCLPYSNNRDSFELNICQFKDSIYIEEHDLPRLEKSFGSTEKEELMTYWGYKFETLSTVSKPPCEIKSKNDPALLSRQDEVTNTNVQYCSVFRSKIGPHSIVMGGEVDCIYTDSPTNQPHRVYAELKTNRIITSERQRENFERFKLLRVWAQSYLAGVSKVIVGFRDDAGTLKTVERFNTSEIPRFVRDKGLWDPHVCIGFTAKVLEWLQGELDGVDDAHEVYRLKSTNGSELELEGPLNDHPSFLPSWWIDELKGDSV